MYYLVEQLQYQVRKSLAAAVKEVLPEAEINEHQLYRAFKRAINRKCGQWQQVPDQYVGRE